jgi:hypothetical protein
VLNVETVEDLDFLFSVPSEGDKIMLHYTLLAVADMRRVREYELLTEAHT